MDRILGIAAYLASCARHDGGLNPGPNPRYRGRSDTSFSDIAAPVYALILEETLGLGVLDRAMTLRFLKSCRGRDGIFRSIRRFRGVAAPAHLQLYNSLQALLGQRIIMKNRIEPGGLSQTARAVRRFYRQGHFRKFPPYALDFLGQFFNVIRRPFPTTMARAVTAEYLKKYRDGEVAGHVASTFHFVRHALLSRQRLPQARDILKKTLSLQRRNGSFNVMPDPDWDVHATFDGCFIVRQLGARLGWKREYTRALKKAARFALSCRNRDGGFGHFPGYPSDMDACYFHAGTMVMAGELRREPVPDDLGRVLGWGHVFPCPKGKEPAI